MNDSNELSALLKEVAANQQSMHDDIAALVDKLSSLGQVQMKEM